MTAEASQPSAFAASQIQLSEFIDLEQFPIHDLTSLLRQELVLSCRQALAADGCAHIPGFISPSAITAMCAEANRLMPHARQADARVNPYLIAEDTSLPQRDPRRFFETRTSAFINSDHLEPMSLLRKIYDSDVMVHFVAECLNQGPIYRWAEPLGRNPYSVMHDGDYFPWHFDGNDFTVSILVQESETGGDFEYVPNIRSPKDERFDDVSRVLFDGERSKVKTLALKTGDLQLFKGRYSIHRVTKTYGQQARIIALPTYVTNPYLVNRPHHARAFYGKAMDIHYERDLARLDQLTD
ncbi:MAG: hypothetical protein KC426_05805 [Oceanospirillaceae bacterium]|nr:hypothetical protein [Oceanospirillaceae bacterium]